MEASQKIRVIVSGLNGNIKSTFEMRKGSNLWVFLRKNNLNIGASCSGVGVCGACDVRISCSEAGAVNPKNEFESETLSRNSKAENHRLACLCRIYGDIEVTADYW